jgi:hypothetical protein
MSFERAINRNNYEEYFLDWLDGNLDGSLLPSFLHFLEENPDLAAQLREMEQLTLSPYCTPQISDKTSLKKKVLSQGGISGTNYEEKMVASMEGELSPHELGKLEEFIALNPALHYDLGLYLKTRLEPDMQVTYPGKEKLKHRPALYINLWRVAAPAAAAVLLAFLLWKVFTPVPEVVVTTPGIASAQEKATEATDEIPVANEVESVQAVLPVIAPSREQATEEMAAVNVRPEPLTLRPIDINGIVLRKKITAMKANQTAMAGTEARAYNPKAEKQGLLGKILRNYSEKASDNKNMIREAVKENAPDGSFNFWELADLGVKSFSKLTDRDLALSVVKDKTGSPMSYSLKEDDRILLSRPLNQP